MSSTTAPGPMAATPRANVDRPDATLHHRVSMANSKGQGGR